MKFEVWTQSGFFIQKSGKAIVRPSLRFPPDGLSNVICFFQTGLGALPWNPIAFGPRKSTLKFPASVHLEDKAGGSQIPGSEICYS